MIIHLAVCYEGSMSVQTEPEYHEHGMRTYVGQVKVCINGSYHEICDVGWDDLDAQMVCNYWFGSDYGELFKSTTEVVPPYCTQGQCIFLNMKNLYNKSCLSIIIIINAQS